MRKSQIDRYGRKYINYYDMSGYLTHLNLLLHKKNITPKRLKAKLKSDRLVLSFADIFLPMGAGLMRRMFTKIECPYSIERVAERTGLSIIKFHDIEEG